MITTKNFKLKIIYDFDENEYLTFIEGVYNIVGNGQTELESIKNFLGKAECMKINQIKDLLNENKKFEIEDVYMKLLKAVYSFEFKSIPDKPNLTLSATLNPIYFQKGIKEKLEKKSPINGDELTVYDMEKRKLVKININNIIDFYKNERY